MKRKTKAKSLPQMRAIEQKGRYANNMTLLLLTLPTVATLLRQSFIYASANSWCSTCATTPLFVNIANGLLLLIPFVGITASAIISATLAAKYPHLNKAIVTVGTLVTTIGVMSVTLLYSNLFFYIGV